MRFLAGLLAIARLSSAASSKRGLCFTPNEAHPQDNQVWVKPGSDLKWYYNYQSLPSPAYASLSQDDFEYIPMMWGVGSNPNDTTFYDQVKKLVDDGTKIQHVLGFNEPDGPADQGGSNIKPKDAAQAWVANFEPLGKMGIKLGLPACTGSLGGLPWLKQFLGNCSELVSTGSEKKNCTWDFLPVHWYDNFAGLASHIGERRATWPDAEIWVTEYAYAHQDLTPTQEFYNQSIDYFEKLDYIGRYSYFGAFRASKANVGPNAAFLSNGGKLTDIGSWYLGFNATGVNPQSGKGAMAVPSVVLVGAGVAAGLVINLF
ncbi:Alkali-sensitive linkage protein 1 [Tolypocladium ophioglossoides CBS 100239]|uniref:Alkali-sensitive linkage protein 1 n=1 Tax=Tolypocladium ophioglossoides (strain CBS 100239) TaxID=1163406 RepID=A0A0L0MZ10_TOLOC|nr:Alkali-sensitive linkage protein 1 [Tolypocladium ophioglossoides CBS 100239]